jgi:hypothetical protein
MGERMGRLVCELFVLSSRHPATVRIEIRLGGFDEAIELAEESGALQHLDRCMAQFEDFCVITESIRHGIPVSVKVVDAAGRTLHDSGKTPS